MRWGLLGAQCIMLRPGNTCAGSVYDDGQLGYIWVSAPIISPTIISSLPALCCCAGLQSRPVPEPEQPWLHSGMSAQTSNWEQAGAACCR